MPVAIRPFERHDRDQLTALVNLHVAEVIPGVVLSVNAVLGQLEREPQENIVDPWVAERRCLVAQRHDGIVSAALLHRRGSPCRRAAASWGSSRSAITPPTWPAAPSPRAGPTSAT